MIERNLPIKVIMPRSKDYVNNNGGGGDKFFCEVTSELQNNLIQKFDKMNEYFSDLFEEDSSIPAIGKIIVREEAIAKSHRPNDLLRNCPVVGVGRLNELYVKVSKNGIKETIKLIEELPSKKVKANITTIENIEPYYANDKVSNSLTQMFSNDEFESIKDRIKIKLFNLDNEFDNELLHRYFEKKISELGLSNRLDYIRIGDSLEYIKLSVDDYEQIEKLSDINGVKTIDFFHQYSTPLQEVTDTNIQDLVDFNSVDSEIMIGIIDGGISKNNPLLEPYVVERVEYVPKEYQNPHHATFIASTIQYGNSLNGLSGDNRRYKFLDIVAVPNSDPDYGPVDSLQEDDLMQIIEEVMEAYSDKVKIWNLSLGNENRKCSDIVSDLGEYLDYIHDRYGVQFIVSSGNINQLPLRTWPPQDGLGEHDRLISPGDSLKALTVGSVALYDSNNSIVMRDDPSPFSRRGPGANFNVKPELVDYGGNITKDLSIRNHAMRGMGVNGEIVEGNGTSYSTPRIVKKVADIYDDLIDKDILLSKALAIHSARINSREVLKNEDFIKYYGFGIPMDNISQILQCSKDEVTLVFKQTLIPGSHLELIDFPYPKSLIKNGKFHGEIGMTLAYNPTVDARFGQEYCRVNVDVSFGTYNFIQDKMIFKGQVPLEKNWDEKFEKSQVENGFKWSPIKSYYRKFKNGISLSDGWKLRVNLQGRSNSILEAQEFVLIMTIKDPDGNDIYTDMVNGLRENGYLTNNLEIKQHIRERI